MGILKTGTQLVKSLFNSPMTNSYPKGEAHIADESRGTIVIDENACTLCGLCYRRCPSGAIVTRRDDGSWLIDRMKCIACGECVYECPENCLEMVKDYVVPEHSVVVDVFNVQAVPGSDSILEGVENPPGWNLDACDGDGKGIKLREVQRHRRNRRSGRGINKRKKNNRAFHRNRSR